MTNRVMRGMRHGLTVPLGIAVLFAPAVLLGLAILGPPAYGAPAATRFYFPPADFIIMNGSGTAPIGRARFTITRETNGDQTVHGDYRYNNGESDDESDRIRARPGHNLPLLVRSEHKYFHADRSLDRVGEADPLTGQASCTIYHDGRPETWSARLNFPSDTFAGAAVIIPLREHAMAGDPGPITFHDFNCLPEPKVVKVTGEASAAAPWPHFPGDLVRFDVKPTFGWYDILIEPFIPRLHAWFDPAGNWDFVGGATSRYYKGIKIMLVREPAPATAAQRHPAGGGASANGRPSATD